MSHPHSSSGCYLFAHSLQLFLLPLPVFLCAAGIYTHTFGDVCVSCEGVSRSKRDETERKSHKTSQKRRIWAQEVKAAKENAIFLGGGIVSFPQTIIKMCCSTFSLAFEKY